MNRFAPALLVLVVLAAFALGEARPGRVATAAAPDAAPHSVVVDGASQVDGVPDIVRVTFGASANGKDVTTALHNVDLVTARVRAELRKDGAGGNDVQTQNVSIYPMSTKKGRVYQVSEQLTAKLPRAAAGRAISHAVTVGGPTLSLQSVTFALEDDVKLLNRARTEAFADAKAKGERYAALSGVSLGKVELLTETTSGPQTYDSKRLAFSGDLVAAAPQAAARLYAGTSQVSVSVTVRWALS